MKINLPSHIQCLTLASIGTEEVTGNTLRARLLEAGIVSEGPAFYQMMKRLEADGLTVGRYAQVETSRQPVTIHCYTTTEKGRATLAAVVEFYRGFVK